MSIFVNGGVITYGTNKIIVPTQTVLESVSGLTTGQKRVDLIYVDSSGNVGIAGGIATSGTPTIPDYTNKIVLAEIALAYGQTSIVQANVTDVRPFLNLGASGSLNGAVVGLLLMGG
jgi:hypothetical protein